MIAETVSNILMLLGVAFSLLGSVGVIRLPDFYTRAHAATKPDTLGLILVMVGLAVRQGFDINSAKLLLIVAFVAMANPAGAHALGRSAIRTGLQPWLKREKS